MSENRILKRTVWMVFTILGLMAAGGLTCAAQTCTYPDVLSGGIWIYPNSNANFTFTIINLTEYPLSSVPRAQVPNSVTVTHGTYPNTYSYPFERFGDPFVVPPFRSLLWKSGFSPVTYPQHYDGRMRFNVTAPSWTKTFEVSFRGQEAKGISAGNGTWIQLAQAIWNPNAGSVWCMAETGCGGVWATPWMTPLYSTSPSFVWDYNMHSIMTMTSPTEVVVALYTPDNLNVVLVVRQINKDEYFGNRLDWVDSDKATVPGDCNN